MNAPGCEHDAAIPHIRAVSEEAAIRKALCVLDTHRCYAGRKINAEWNRAWLDDFARDVLEALDAAS